MTSQKAIAKRSMPRLRFINETVAELKKVVWLSRREVAYLTSLVLIVSIVVGIILGVIDFGFSKLINVLIGGG